MDLYIGQKIRSATNDLVEIVSIQGLKVKLVYKCKEYILNKYILGKYLTNKIGKELFVIDNNTKNNTNMKNEKTVNTDESCKSCANCMEYKNGNCFGLSEICNDFRYSPKLSNEELSMWPKDGQVSRTKSNTFFIREYDCMYNKYNETYH